MSNVHSFDVPYHPSDKVMVTDKNGTPLHLHSSGHLIHPETGQSHGTFSWSKQDGRHMLTVSPKHKEAAYEAGSGEAMHPKVAVHAPPMVKGDGDGEFRGGDPEEIEIKKEEKELGKGVKKTQKVPRDPKKLLVTMIHRLEGGHVSKKPKVSKADPGEEAGAFRGGDPEEIRIKREEKLQDMQDSGELEDQGDTGDEPTEDEIEEAKEEDQQKKEDQGKSLLVAKAMAHVSGQQVSPVDHFGEYCPRDANGDPVSLKIQEVDERYREPAPVRPGANQNKLWSEVTGMRVPLTGNPMQELRRYHAQGRSGPMDQSAFYLAKAIHRYPTGLLSIWRDDFVGGQFYTGNVNKGIGDAPAPHHKYVKRWFENGKWQYAYQDEPHTNHGLGAMHDISGHTVEVHPGFKQAGQPGSEEKAFEYSRRAHLAEGGEWPAQVWDPNQERLVDKKMISAGSKDKEGNILHDKEGMPVIDKKTKVQFEDPATGKRSRAGDTVTAIESNLRPPQTIYDPYGDPWMHYQVRQSSKDPSTLGVPRIMFDHRSRFNPDIDPTDPDYMKKKHTPSHKKTVDELRDWAAQQQSYMEFLKDQEGKSQMHPEERKTHTAGWEPTFGHKYDLGTGKVALDEQGNPVQVEHKTTNALERGDVGSWSWKPNHLFVRAGDKRGPLSRDQQVPHSKRAVHHGVALHIPEEHEAQFYKDMLEEHGAALRGVAGQVLRRKGLRTWGDHDLSTKEGRSAAKDELLSEAVGALPDIINSYNPQDPSKSRRLSEHIQRKADDAMTAALEHGMGASTGEKRHSMRRASDLARNVERKKKQIEQDVAAGDESGFAKRRRETLPQLQAELERHQAAAGIEREGAAKPTGSTYTGSSPKSSDEGAWTARRPAGGEARQGRQEGGMGLDMGTAHISTPEQAALRKEDEARRRKHMIESGEAVGRVGGGLSEEEKQGHLNQFEQWLKREGKGKNEILGMMRDWHTQDPKGFDEYLGGANTPAWTRTAYEHHTGHTTGEHVADPSEFERSINYHAMLMAMDVISKAEEGTEDDPNQMHYAWREGEPGAHKYMYKDNFGEHVRGTNAPEGHPHHDPAAGPPQVHPHEPTRESAPYMFDEFGRKLHRPAPEGVETEPNTAYDSEVNHWAQKYEDPDTGNEEFISLHRDRVGSHRLALNEAIRQVDSQLEKVRSFYQRLIKGRDLRQRAAGLVLALVDQARAVSDGDDSGLLSMKVKDVSLAGNSFKMRYKDANGDSHVVTAVLDSASSGVLHELAQGKKPGDKLFEVEGQPIQQSEVAQLLDQKFGLQLKQLRIYHATELFSKEFQRLAGDQASLEPRDLPRIADKAYARVLRLMGHQKPDPKLAQKTLVDPVTVEALFMSAIHHHDPKASEEIAKAYKLQGRAVFQGLPVSIENRKGSVRHWKDKDSKTEGTTKMHYAYGYVRGTEGTDGDEVDVYIGPHKESDKVFVIHQMKLPDFKEFDEDKCMLGFKTGAEAKAAYLKQYDNPKFFGSMTVMSMNEFKDKINATKKRPQMIKGWVPGAPNIPSPTNPSQKRSLQQDAAHALVNHHLMTVRGNHDEAKTWGDHAHRLSKIAGAGPTRGMVQSHVRLWEGEHRQSPTRMNSEHLSAARQAARHPLVGARIDSGSTGSGPVEKSFEVYRCSMCFKSWGSCEHSEPIEKAFRGSADTGPVTWTVTISHPKRTPDEKMFGDWVHSHPQHEHDQHWSAFKQATKVEDLPEPDHGREYACGGDSPDSEHPEFDREESHQFGPGEEQESGEGREPETAKSLLDSMIQAAS